MTTEKKPYYFDPANSIINRYRLFEYQCIQEQIKIVNYESKAI